MSLRKAESHSGLRPSLVPPGVFFFLLIFLYLPAKTTEADCSFPAIFNFGDSNSDTGGFWAAFPAQRAPFGMTYFKKPAGRASDGRAVIDFLAQALGLPFLSPYLQSIGSNFSHGANFATASSTVLLPSLFVTGISPFSLAIQLNQMNELRVRVFEMSPQDYLPSKGIFAKALYTFDIGQNDFAYIGIGGDKQFLSQVANQIAWTIKELYNNGGRTFMVFNLAPLGCFPSTLTLLPHNESDLDEYGCLISYNNAILDYNQLLKETLQQTQSELQNASVIYVDTHSVKLEVFQHPKKYGFIYGTKACCGSGGGSYNYNPQVFCGNNKIINGINVTASACSDPQNYVSWDGVHATEATNKIIIRAILSGSYFDPPFPLSHLCNLKPIC
ncbi:GDSL esterase/lipase At4g01130-like isoform X1 [Dendrobium catenatum]|uniref:GDSL esterase/lipase n=1 Tax=Dendrobium catenatum TaxID=906689 RepID=A0A2I0X8B9_9ASPA|nr:GDSL esterase/lipase At4g01130-like isoform X1 [Dendrobium catenatum]PKU84142.1 GDSL esterase/lipase [Dendrobium catenatum]